MIKVVTIEREYGCGGGEIAHKLADRLRWKLWDQELTCEIARLTRTKESDVQCREEQRDPLYYRLFKSILRGSFEGSHNLGRLQMLDADCIFRYTKQIVQRAAAEGECVIVGRGSQHFLQDRADTLRVFLFAPREDKLRRLTAGGISEKEAQELLENVDKERAAFIDKYLQMEWPNRSLYHAMLNTASGDETVIETILNLKNALERKSERATATL